MSASEVLAPVTRREARPRFDVEAIRADFPILSKRIYGKPLVYLDNAATAQKPRCVIDRMKQFQEEEYANVHRGVHHLSQVASEAFEKARGTVKNFIGARSEREVIFTRGTTESINLVASCYGRSNVQKGDEILISAMEHHSNIVPWQMLCKETGAKLKVIPMNDAGELDFDAFEELLGENTRFVSIVHISNALGTVNPVKEIVKEAHKWGVPVLVDGAQSAPHQTIDVKDIGCDFYAFSGHKVYGPNGVGVLYGKEELLQEMPPYQGGGDMIRSVTFERTLYNDLPYKFEAGTPNITGVVGMAVALDYLNEIGLDEIERYEQELLDYGTQALLKVPGLELKGTARNKASVLSFVLESAHPHDIGTILDQEAIAIRTGHHCAQPVMDRLGVPATARASIAFYNTEEEIDVLVKGLLKVNEVFA